MALFRIGRPLRAGADADTSIMGGTLWGFACIWGASFALGNLLGDQAPTRADGGLASPSNLIFFVVLELATGALGGLVTVRSESRSATFRLALVVALVGGVIAVLASGTPNVPVSGGLIVIRSLVQAAGVLLVAMLAAPPAPEPTSELPAEPGASPRQPGRRVLP